jgi:glutamate-1-semialdehyde 2,1-aminomutase
MLLFSDGSVILDGPMNRCYPCFAAAQATIDVLERDNVHARLFDLGIRLMKGLSDVTEIAGQPMLIQGLGPMFHTGFTSLEKVRDYRETLSYDKAKYGKFVFGMQERGIRLIGRGLWYISGAHTVADIDQAVATAGEVLSELKD